MGLMCQRHSKLPSMAPFRLTEEVVKEGLPLEQRVVHRSIAVDEDRTPKETALFERAVRIATLSNVLE